jgi:hypothetical protein
MASLRIERGWSMVSLVRSVQYVPDYFLEFLFLSQECVETITPGRGSGHYLRAAMVIA